MKKVLKYSIIVFIKKSIFKKKTYTPMLPQIRLDDSSSNGFHEKWHVVQTLTLLSPSVLEKYLQLQIQKNTQKISLSLSR